MCLQFVCYICGDDLEDDKSLVLCHNSMLTLQVKSRDYKDCPDYVRKEAGAPIRCNLCLEADPSVAGTLLARINPAFGYLDSSYLSQFPADGSALLTQAPLTFLPIHPQYSPPNEEPKRTEVPSWENGTTASTYETTDGNRQISAPTESRGLFGNQNGFRRLLPKSLSNNDAFHSLAPPPTSLQNPLYFAGSRAIDDAGFATASDGSFSPAQSGPDRVREASTAKSITGLRSQESQSGGREVLAHTNPKILINRVRKPEKRRQRAPKTAVACENCRCSHVKCTGEVPSCEICFRKGKQCGYHPASKIITRRGQVAAVRINLRPLQPLEQHGTIPQAPAPQRDVWNLPLDQGLQQHATTNYSTLTNDVGTYPVDFPVQYPFQLRAISRQANTCQGDEARSRDRTVSLEHERMTCLRKEMREQQEFKND